MIAVLVVQHDRVSNSNGEGAVMGISRTFPFAHRHEAAVRSLFARAHSHTGYAERFLPLFDYLP